MNQERRNLSVFGFFLLFPGFFFYHYSVGTGYVTPFLGGYFSYVAVGVLLLLLLSNVKAFVRIKNNIKFLFLALLSWTFLITVVNYLLDNPSGFTKEMLIWSLQGILFNFLCYLLAKDLCFSERSKHILLACFVLMFFLVILNVGSSGIFYLKQDAGDVADSVATYQGFARCLVFVLLFQVSFYFKDNKFLLFLIVLLGSIALFFNGARTEFVLFFASIVSLFLINSLRSVKTFLFGVLMIGVLVIVGLYFIELVPQSRMFQLENLEESSSFQSRSFLNDNALKIIDENPILGAYGAYTNIGGIGHNAHNLLSAWVNLGVIGFLGYIVLLVSLWGFVAKTFIKRRIGHERFNVFFLFLIFTTLALILSKDYSNMMVGFLVGLYANLINDRQNNDKNHPPHLRPHPF